VNVCDDGVFHCVNELFQNREIHFARRSHSTLSSRIKPAKDCVTDGGAEGFEFFASSPSAASSTRPSDKLRTYAGDFKSGGDGSCGVAEPDALHAA
jgi:hypothetical protein